MGECRDPLQLTRAARPVGPGVRRGDRVPGWV